MNLKYFTDKKISFALVRGEKIIYKSKKQRLAPLIFCLKKYKKQIRGATIFDKVVGRAAALLLVYGGAKKVFTLLISRGALIVLKRGGVQVQYQKIVKCILNVKGDDLCPMEKMSQGKNPEQFVKVMKL